MMHLGNGDMENGWESESESWESQSESNEFNEIER